MEEFMKKKFGFFNVIEILLGTFCFMAYYLLMSEYFKVSPLRGLAIIPTVYFILAILTLPFVYESVVKKIGDFFLTTNVIILTLAYIFGPVILFYKKFSKNR